MCLRNESGAVVVVAAAADAVAVAGDDVVVDTASCWRLTGSNANNSVEILIKLFDS